MVHAGQSRSSYGKTGLDMAYWPLWRTRHWQIHRENLGIKQPRFKSLRFFSLRSPQGPELKDQMSGEQFQTLNDLKSLVELLIRAVTPEQWGRHSTFFVQNAEMCSERWWPYWTASIKLSRWKTVTCFCIKMFYLLSEWFFCISVKACCITFQGHLVNKDFVEIIEFGTQNVLGTFT